MIVLTFCTLSPFLQNLKQQDRQLNAFVTATKVLHDFTAMCRPGVFKHDLLVRTFLSTPRNLTVFFEISVQASLPFFSATQVSSGVHEARTLTSVKISGLLCHHRCPVMEVPCHVEQLDMGPSKPLLSPATIYDF